MSAKTLPTFYDHETREAEYAFLAALRAIAACHEAQALLSRKLLRAYPDAPSLREEGRYYMNRFSVSNEHTPYIKRSGYPPIKITPA